MTRSTSKLPDTAVPCPNPWLSHWSWIYWQLLLGVQMMHMQVSSYCNSVKLSVATHPTSMGVTMSFTTLLASSWVMSPLRRCKILYVVQIHTTCCNTSSCSSHVKFCQVANFEFKGASSIPLLGYMHALSVHHADKFSDWVAIISPSILKNSPSIGWMGLLWVGIMPHELV